MSNLPSEPEFEQAYKGMSLSHFSSIREGFSLFFSFF